MIYDANDGEKEPSSHSDLYVEENREERRLINFQSCQNLKKTIFKMNVENARFGPHLFQEKTGPNWFFVMSTYGLRRFLTPKKAIAISRNHQRMFCSEIFDLVLTS